MDFIKIGNYQIKRETLKGISFTRAKEIFSNIPEKTLKAAYDSCNPKPTKKKKST